MKLLKLIALGLLVPTLLFGSRDVMLKKGYQIQKLTQIAIVTASTEFVSATSLIGEYSFFSIQVQTTGTTVDIDSIVVESSHESAAGTFIRAIDASKSNVWARVLSDLTTTAFHMATIAAVPSQYIRFRVFSGSTASADGTVTISVGKFP